MRPLFRGIYRALPDHWQDTPTAWLKYLTRDMTKVQFIQIGAFDGIADDPIRPLIMGSQKWTGVLVEPQQHIFEKLQMNYAGIDNRLSFLNCAISSAKGELTFYSIPEAEIERLCLEPWVRELASTDAQNILRRLPGVGTCATRIPCMTFQDALKATNRKSVDCVIIDAEGHEYEIIKGIDFDKHGIKIILYEFVHLSSEEAAALARRLEACGFRLKYFGYDIIAWR
jgi:FkbM family methyltransferase